MMPPMHARYYLNNADAYRLKLLLPLSEAAQQRLAAQQAEADALLLGPSAAQVEMQPIA